MTHVLEVLLPGWRGLDRLGPRGRIVLGQLPLNLAVLLMAPVLAVAAPGRLFDPLFVLGQGSALAVLGLSAAVPWARLPHAAFLAVPFLDFIPVAALRAATTDTLAGVGLLAVFPVMWLAVSRYRPRAVVPLGAAAVLAMVWAPLLAEDRAAPTALAAQLAVPAMMLVIGAATSVMAAGLQAQADRAEELAHRSEARQRLLEAVLETVDVGVAVLDPQGSEVLVNARLRALRRSAPPEAPGAGMPLRREGSPAPLAPAERPVARAAAGEEFSHEVFRLGVGAKARSVSVAARQFPDPDGGRGGAVLAYSDITDVLAAVKAREGFVAAMSHEFRTPLTSIVGYTELLQDEPGLAPDVRSDLRVVTRNARHLQKMVEDVLAAATGGALEAAPTRLDLALLARDAAASAAREAEDRGIRLVLRTQPAPVLGDATGLTRVLENLLSNALKYSPPGTEVAITARRDGDWAVVSVQDQGIGMSPEDAQRAFERFHRGDQARRSGVPGTGLGLALANEVALGHGGRLECTSALGAGSTFTLRIPTAAPAPD